MTLTAGAGRTVLTPYWGVELTGWGYYLERTWKSIHDDLHATAVVFDNSQTALAVISLDLMVISTEFTCQVRDQVHSATGIPQENILVAATHTHSAPASGGLLGVGEVDPDYEAWAARQAATAAILAWQRREPASVSTAHADLPGQTFNRTREGGPVDTRITTCRVDRQSGGTIAMLVNFQAHPTVHTVLQPFAVSRDVPGEVCDHLEAALPGALALYLQGACGDVNFLREFSTPQHRHEPARRLAGAALAAHGFDRTSTAPRLAACVQTVQLPTRRWEHAEIEADRGEAQRRLAEHDISGWRETIGRVMTNRPDEMVDRHGGNERKAVEAMCRFNLAWTYRMLQDYETRDTWLETEVQALRVGNLGIVANTMELFTSFALDVRARCNLDDLMISCYSNGRNGYMPDAHDIALRSYAAYQSPKYCNQFPFTDDSGPTLCEAMLSALTKCQDAT